MSGSEQEDMSPVPSRKNKQGSDSRSSIASDKYPGSGQEELPGQSARGEMNDKDRVADENEPSQNGQQSPNNPRDQDTVDEVDVRSEPPKGRSKVGNTKNNKLPSRTKYVGKTNNMRKSKSMGNGLAEHGRDQDPERLRSSGNRSLDDSDSQGYEQLRAEDAPGSSRKTKGNLRNAKAQSLDQTIGGYRQSEGEETDRNRENNRQTSRTNGADSENFRNQNGGITSRENLNMSVDSESMATDETGSNADSPAAEKRKPEFHRKFSGKSTLPRYCTGTCLCFNCCMFHENIL